MNKLFVAMRHLPKRTSALVAMVAAAVIVPAALLAWGPDRPTFTMEQPADHVTFNSITNNPNIGDERNFVTIRENGSNTTWNDDMTVVPGKEYAVRMYVHNNAAANLKLVAKDVTAKFNLPTTTGKSVEVQGFVNSSNASPKEVYDHATFKSTENFNLDYQEGSLRYNNNGFGKNGVAIPESVFTSKGALLGYDKLDGKIPGCLQYSGYLSFIVRPQFAKKSDFTASKTVSKHGENKWVENYATKPGETVDYLVKYKNTGTIQHDNVMLVDKLPTGMTYVNGSSVLGNSFHPTGIKTNDGITAAGLNIGSYAPGGNAWVIFSAKAPASAATECGVKTLKNIVKVETDYGTKEDSADITIDNGVCKPKECKPGIPVGDPRCNPPQECKPGIPVGDPRCNPPVAKYTCDALTVTKISRTSFKFATTYTVQNATFKSTTYVVRDEAGTELYRGTNADYSQEKVGKYTVEAIVTVSVNGVDKTVTSENCKKPFEVEKLPVVECKPGIPMGDERCNPPVAKYTCDALTVTSISRTNFKFDTTYTVQNATFKSTTYVVRDEAGTELYRSTTATYNQEKVGKYTVEAIVTVTVDGVDKVVTNANCKKPFEITAVPVQECKPGIPMGDARCNPEEKCTVPGKEHLPKNSPDCKVDTPVTPPELPQTGAGDDIAALIGAGSLIAASLYYFASRRNNA